MSIDSSIILFLSVQPCLGKTLSCRLPSVLAVTFILPPLPQSLAVDSILPNETKTEFLVGKKIVLLT